MDSSSTLFFTVNGNPFSVKEPEIGTSLNTWLRSTARLTGTKQMCKEGGCGSCVVMVTRTDPATGQDVSISVNSCLFPLLCVDGCHITTTEGLVSDQGQYDAIQERVAHFNGTQCGYCTPGFVMTMHSLLQKNPNPTQDEIENEFDGNICRCTGYRSIMDAMKSFAKDADPKLTKIVGDIEDLRICTNEKSSCGKNGVNCKKSCGRYQADGIASNMHKDQGNWNQLVHARSFSLKSKSGDDTVTWSRPATMQDLTTVVKNNAAKKVRFVVGNTSTGIYKNEGPYDVYVDTKLIPELSQITDTETQITFGANVSLNELISTFESKSSQSQVYDVIAKHIRKIANNPVRNVGSWIGNLSIKRLHPEFPSDIFTLFAAFAVKLKLRNCQTGTDSMIDLIGQNGFMSQDMNGKVVTAAVITKPTPAEKSSYHALSFKVMARSQATLKSLPYGWLKRWQQLFYSDVLIDEHKITPGGKNSVHAYINAAFHATVSNGVINDCAIVFGGVSKTFVHAQNTEKYLTEKPINSQDTLNGALKALEAEVKPEIYSAVDSSVKYRSSLCQGLFFKFFLSICDKASVSSLVASAIGEIERPLTSGTQTYDSDASKYPLNEPMPKISAIKQASGEAVFTSDFATISGELFAVFITSTVANADIEKIDSSATIGMPGFHSIITGGDIPSELNNTFCPPPYAGQTIIAENHVDFAGQPIAIVLADSQDHAENIAKAVVVTYTNKQSVVTNMEDAIEKQMFFDGAGDPVVVGDAPTAIANAPQKISGRIRMGSQYHFYMETQIARAQPSEDGFDIECATQWQDLLQMSLAHVFSWDSNRFNITTARVGGAYGGKATNSWLTGTAATLASYISGRPVRLHSDLSTCMETFGRRAAYVADYTVGFNSDGKLQGIEATYYSDSGVSVNDSDIGSPEVKMFADSGYYFPNWKITPKWVKTNVTSNTWCRAPASAQVTMIMEVILEHVAKAIDADPIHVKEENLLVTNQLNLFGEPLTYCELKPISQSLLSSTNVTQRQTQIDAFNAANKWKKRGIGFTPAKFGVAYNGANYSMQVSIIASDGSVILSSAGIESGQGINTKLIQVASYILGAPLDLIRVRKTTNLTTPNSGPTGGSLTSELCCQGMVQSCNILKTRINAMKKKLNLNQDMSWKEKIAKCFAEGVDLTANSWVFNKTKNTIVYNCYGAACSEVEMDIITGEFVIRRVDILYDCGQSINPEIDVGQAEGAFLMGVGYFTCERIVFDPTSGQLLTNGTWEYHPPASKDIPTEWNITFLKDAPNPGGVLSSKAVGEPPLLTSASVVFAIKRCIEAFRRNKSYFSIDLPATVERVQQLCQIATSDYTL